MTTSPIAATDVAPGKGQRRWVRPTLYAVGGIVLLVVGILIGIATQQSTITSYKHQVAQLQDQVSADKSKVSYEQSQLTGERLQVTNAQTQAKNALSIATAKVNGQYKAKFAALQAQEKTVAGMRAKLNRELGIVAKSTISQDGVYVVGKDIPPGVYHTLGAGANASPGGACYFATLVSSTNTSDVNNISDNNNFNGPETVDLSGMYAFQISGGCTWHKIG
jgi:hypothetical protein